MPAQTQPPAQTQSSEGVAIYRCPTCHTPLRFEVQRDDSGVLRCEGGHSFPVEGGLPRFVPDEGYADSFGLQWQNFSRSQLDSNTGIPASRERLFKGTGWPERMDGELILEAGCGMGRFTEVLLSTGARVVSFDYSRAADITHKAFGAMGARVCQASIFEMPFRPGSFDRVFCYGVIQHTPDVRRAFFELAKMVKPGGHLAIDVYDRRKMWFNARYRVRWLTKRIDKRRLLQWCKTIVPAYMRVVPPLHPWNQLFVPIKDYRGALGLDREREIEISVLDTMDMLSPAFDSPQYLRTIKRWFREAGFERIEAWRGGNGIEARGRRPA